MLRGKMCIFEFGVNCPFNGKVSHFGEYTDPKMTPTFPPRGQKTGIHLEEAHCRSEEPSFLLILVTNCLGHAPFL